MYIKSVLPLCALALGCAESMAYYIPRDLANAPHRTQHRKQSRSTASTCSTDGAWKCNGNQLTRCVFGQTVIVATCSGPNIVCNDQGSTTGCIWGTTGATGANATTPDAVPSSNVPSPDPASPDPVPVPAAPGTNDTDGVPVPPATTTDDSPPAPGAGINISGIPKGPASTDVPAPPTQGIVAGPGTGEGTGNATGEGSGGGTYGGVIKNVKAPHHVMYANKWMNKPPAASELAGWNRFILSFYTSAGPLDLAKMWMDLPKATKISVLEEYHAKGIALMVAAFGETDSNITKDPVETAKQMAKFVKEQMLDGLDIDYEDIEGMKSPTRRNSCVKWVIDFTNAIRKELPPPYLISSAPLAPWFVDSGPEVYKNTYNEILKSVGDKMDFINIQYYNQGPGYDTCDQLLVKGDKYPGSAMLEIKANTQTSLDKLVLGKPLGPAGYASNGYTDISILKQCIAQGKSKGWSGSIMFWQWSPTEAPAVAKKLFG